MTRLLAATVGVFDGVHLGHQALLKAMAAEKGKSLVITFSSHPRADRLLFGLDTRIREIRSLGIDDIECLSFEEIKETSPEQFLDSLIARGLTDFFLGYDNHIGKGRSGTPVFIKSYLSSKNVRVHEVEPILIDHQPISSRRIRALIEHGKLKEAEALLGKPWGLYGAPIKGLGLGTKIGIPTLNFSFDGLVVPPFGVYITALKAGSKSFKSVANIGISPTLKEQSPPLLEVHLLDAQPLPSPPYQVIPLLYLRKEQAFASVEELKNAIQKDVMEALKFQY